MKERKKEWKTAIKEEKGRQKRLEFAFRTFRVLRSTANATCDDLSIWKQIGGRCSPLFIDWEIFTIVSRAVADHLPTLLITHLGHHWLAECNQLESDRERPDSLIGNYDGWLSAVDLSSITFTFLFGVFVQENDDSVVGNRSNHFCCCCSCCCCCCCCCYSDW